MEIRPASIAQITKARNGQWVEISADVGGVAQALSQIDSHLRLRASEVGDFYTVYWSEPGGDEYLIFTAQDLDQRIVKKMEQVYWECHQPGYSLADEMDKKEAAFKANQDHERLEKQAPVYERLAHAMRKDLGYGQSKVFFG